MLTQDTAIMRRRNPFVRFIPAFPMQKSISQIRKTMKENREVNIQTQNSMISLDF